MVGVTLDEFDSLDIGDAVADRDGTWFFITERRASGACVAAHSREWNAADGWVSVSNGNESPLLPESHARLRTAEIVRQQTSARPYVVLMPAFYGPATFGTALLIQRSDAHAFALRRSGEVLEDGAETGIASSGAHGLLTREGLANLTIGDVIRSEHYENCVVSEIRASGEAVCIMSVAVREPGGWLTSVEGRVRVMSHRDLEQLKLGDWVRRQAVPSYGALCPVILPRSAESRYATALHSVHFLPDGLSSEWRRVRRAA